MNAKSLVDQYLVVRSSVMTDTTAANTRGTLNMFLGAMPPNIESIDTAEIAVFIHKLLHDKLKNPNSVRMYLARMKSFFSWCRLRGFMKHDPLEGLPKIKPAEVHKVPFTWGQYQLVLDAAAKFKGTVRRPAINWVHACTLGWHTGLRFSDCATLRWEMCDFISDVINARPKKMAHVRKEIAIPMEPLLRLHLLSLGYKESGLVDPFFCHEYHSDRPRHLDNFREICDSVGLPRHTFHSLRHSFVSRLLNSGVSAEVVSQLTGQSAAIVSRYAHISIDAKRKAMERAREPEEQPKAEVAA